MALYYVIKTPLEDNPLLHKFVNGDDAFRNSRFKLIPYISKVGFLFNLEVKKTKINHNNMSSSITQYSRYIHILHFLCFAIEGVMDSQAECWEDGMLAGASTRSQLLSREELFGGWLTTLYDNEC